MGKTFHSHACTSTHLWHVKIIHILVKYLQNIVCMLMNYLPILYAVTTTPLTHTHIIQDNYKTKQRVLHAIIACEFILSQPLAFSDCCFPQFFFNIFMQVILPHETQGKLSTKSFVCHNRLFFNIRRCLLPIHQ